MSGVKKINLFLVSLLLGQQHIQRRGGGDDVRVHVCVYVCVCGVPCSSVMKEREREI